MGEIAFYLKKPEPVSGKSLIFLQWKYRGQRLVFSTGESIDPKDWNKKKHRVKNNLKTTASGDHFINDLLETLENQCDQAYRKELKNGIPAPAAIRKHLVSFMNQNLGKSGNPTIWDLIEKFISGEVRDRKERKKTLGTLKNFKTARGHLLAFDKKYKYNLSFDSVNREFLDKYLNYLEKDAKLAPNSIAKNLQTLKVFMNVGLDRNYHSNLFYKKISPSWEESENVALSRNEISKFYNHNFSKNQRLERVRDLFVLGANVGLRISDWSNIKSHNIIDVNGERRIRIKTQKTGSEVEIPCHDQVLEILEKYNDALPKITGEKFNEYVKEAFKEAGFTKTGRLLKSPDKPLYECIASHTCRRSFFTNLYNEGVSSVVLMKISGHKTETSFLKYIKVSQTDAADKLSAHYKKLKTSKLMAV